ncbi:DUF6300 family protein [Streptomyces sp. NPDC057136]|uniref:DUF6300 family protein n=1 Tax=Streptomyces sp. NPDC057136 TaxID=3346029 RepID=UPI00362752C5
MELCVGDGCESCLAGGEDGRAAVVDDLRTGGCVIRVGNHDGSIETVSAEQLARLYPDRDEDQQPARPCSRCGTDLLLHWYGPLMTGIWMELCPACDTRRLAARAFIQWYRDPDRDPKALPKLFEDWDETMHAHGWPRAPQPEAPPSPPSPPDPRTARARLRQVRTQHGPRGSAMTSPGSAACSNVNEMRAA